MTDEPFNRDPRTKWLTCPTTWARHLHGLRAVLAAPAPTPPTDGDGVVYVGGGKFWPGIVVGCKLLREVGCTLPIQVWYRGTCEPVDPAAVEGLGVELVDADAMSERLDDNRVPVGAATTGGWEAKTYALTHCPFRRVLFLDADAYCVADPKPLFDQLDGTVAVVFWRDLHCCEGNVKWLSIWPDGASGVPAFQGGQFVLDRGAGGRLLTAAHWINQHSDFYYKHMFGDQDAWRVALAATGSPHRCLGAAEWPGTAFVCKVGGQPLVVHRCQGKLFRPTEVPVGKSNYSNMQGHLPLEGRVFDILAETLNREAMRAAVFEEHYHRKLWGDPGSGPGSTPPEAKPFVATVRAAAAIAGWRSCVDVGCGDGRVAAAMGFAEYRGYDVAAAAVALFEKNAPGLSVEMLDCYTELDKLPPADVLIVRDVLHHWPTEWVTDWLTRVRAAGKWKAVLLSQDRYQWHDGQDCWVGGYRALRPDWLPLRPFGCLVLTEYLHKAILVLPLCVPPSSSLTPAITCTTNTAAA
jgi:SAM-dependent methyltransferase